MNMTAWLFFALTAPFLFSVSQVFDKFLRDKHLGTWTLEVLLSLASFWVVAILPFVDLRATFSSLIIVLAGFFAGALFVLNSIPYFEAMSVEEASRVIPLWAFESLFVLVFAFFLLNERLHLVDYIGFTMVVAGAFLISAKKVKEVFRTSKAFLLMIFATLLTATGVIIAKWLYQQLSFWQVQLLIGIGGGLTGIIILIAKKTTLREIRSMNKANWVQLDFVSSQ
jgi:uncharacterized membrane protein